MTEADDHALGAQRLDKWLWFARVTKSRTIAASCIAAGKIKVNREKVDKPSQMVKVGDVITSRIQKTVRILRVAAIGTRRGPASEARTLYEDLTPPPPAAALPDGSAPGQWGVRDPGAGRPTKRERREIVQFKERG